MFENYLKVAVRNLFKFKMFSFLNISGLAIGMACCILVFLYIQDEIGYDQFHEKSNRIYRVLREREANSGESHTQPGTSGALAPSLLKDFSEIQSAVRTWDIDTWINYKDKWFQQKFMMTDSQIFEIFSFPFVKGDPRTALMDPYTVVLTQEMANKFFPDEDPIGRTITIEHRYFRGDYKITGVLKKYTNKFDNSIRFSGFVCIIGMETKRICWHRVGKVATREWLAANRNFYFYYKKGIHLPKWNKN